MRKWFIGLNILLGSLLGVLFTGSSANAQTANYPNIPTTSTIRIENIAGDGSTVHSETILTNVNELKDYLANGSGNNSHQFDDILQAIENDEPIAVFQYYDYNMRIYVGYDEWDVEILPNGNYGLTVPDYSTGWSYHRMYGRANQLGQVNSQFEGTCNNTTAWGSSNACWGNTTESNKRYIELSVFDPPLNPSVWFISGATINYPSGYTGGLIPETYESPIEEDIFASCVNDNAPYIHFSDCISVFGRITNMMSFGVIDPLGAFRYEPSTECRELAVLGNWLNLNNKELCPQFSAEVRNIITPFVSFGISLTVLGAILTKSRTDFN